MSSRAAVITGSAGVIGRALCRAFEAAGYAVVGLDRCESGDRCDGIRADLESFVTDDAYRHDLVGRIREAANGEIAVLCNNAAVQRLAATEDVSREDWQESLNVNLAAPLFLAQALLPDLEARNGSVVNIASIHARLTKPRFVTYATTKAALVGLTRAMAVDLGGRVRVNAICPAAIDTPMLRSGFSDAADGDLERLEAHHPVGRIGTAKDVAELAVWLASSRATFISGASYSVTGAIDARLHDPL